MSIQTFIIGHIKHSPTLKPSSKHQPSISGGQVRMQGRRRTSARRCACELGRLSGLVVSLLDPPSRYPVSRLLQIRLTDVQVNYYCHNLSVHMRYILLSSSYSESSVSVLSLNQYIFQSYISVSRLANLLAIKRVILSTEPCTLQC